MASDRKYTQLLRVAADASDDVEEQSSSEIPVPERNSKGVLSRGAAVATLLGICGIAFVLYVHFAPRAEVATQANLQGNIDLEEIATAQSTATVVENILKKSQKAKSKEAQTAGGNGTACGPRCAALKQVQAAEAVPTTLAATISANKEAIKSAINEFTGEEAGVALQEGMVVTSGMLQKINGLPSTPENAPNKPGDQFQHHADMVFPKAKGRRLWAGNLWPNPSQIPYCFKSNAAATSKESFLKALTHIENLVSCIGFKEVATIGDAKCEDGGIFLTSDEPGCWSYVGYVGGSWWSSVVQQLNLQPNGCDYLGIAAHETLHALGMAHEQARSDYNENIVIYWQNIAPGVDRDQYQMDPKGDTSLAYDIMSLMHYGDSDFGIGGAKTMAAIKQHRGVMGQRMGLSSYDAQQLGLMYGCNPPKFSLCTNDPNQCTYDDCTCLVDAGQDMGLVKTFSGWPSATCKRCETQCPSIHSQQCLPACGCGVGYTKKSLPLANGGTCYACEQTSPVSPIPAPSAPTPAPAPPPTPPPTPTCIFPTSPADCSHSGMPGCASCDGTAPWCFTSSQGHYRDCTVADNACYFPFEYGGKDYYTCTTDGGEKKPWCDIVGGGWKYCGAMEGFPNPSGEIAVGPAPTPPPPAWTPTLAPTTTTEKTFLQKFLGLLR